LDEAFDFGEGCGAGVAGGGHGEGAVGYAAAEGPFDGLAGEQAVKQAGGEAVSAADAVVDVDFALGDVDDLVLVEGDGSPGVAAGGGGGAQGAGDELEVGIEGGYLAKHLFVGGDGQLVEVGGDAFELDAQHGGEVFFVAEQDVDLADEVAVDLLGFGLAADGFPERVAVVEVVRDDGAGGAGRVHGFGGDLGGGGGEGGEDSAGMQALRTVLGAEDCGPIEVAWGELADGGVAAVGTAGGGADAETALGEVEAVADVAADAVVLDPLEQREVDTALEHEVFDEAADGVVGERGGDGGAQAEAATEAAGDVVFAAALPDLELAGGVDAGVAGIEAEHDFAEGEAVPAAG